MRSVARLLLCLSALAALAAPAQAQHGAARPGLSPRPPGPPAQPAPGNQRGKVPAPAPRQAGPGAATDPQPADWTARFDELWKTRDDPETLRQIGILVREQHKQDPRSFDAAWRLAAYLAWKADGFEDGSAIKGTTGKLAWEAGEDAVRLRPNDARGQYYAGLGIGLYSEGVGVLTALTQGLEGKFRDRLQAALKLDPDFLDGAPQVVWGRYFFKLPWPKRDVPESLRVLTAAMKSHPDNRRGKLFLADALHDQGKKAEARKLVQELLAAPPSRDVPEDRRVAALAKKWMSEH